MPSSARPRNTPTPSPRQTYHRSGPPNVQSRPDAAGLAASYCGEPPMNLPAHAAPATHPLEIPSQLLMSTDPLMEQTSHQGIPYCRTPAMDSFTGPSNWNRQEVVPPGQSPFQNEGFSQTPSTSVFPTQPLRFVGHEDAGPINTPSQHRVPSNEAAELATETCPFLDCHKTYNRRQDLERHILNHFARSLYCSQPGCNWTGSRRDTLREHLRQRHGGIPVPNRANSIIYDAKGLVKQLLNNEITTEEAVHDARLSFRRRAELMGKLNVWRES